MTVIYAQTLEQGTPVGAINSIVYSLLLPALANSILHSMVVAVEAAAKGNVIESSQMKESQFGHLVLKKGG